MRDVADTISWSAISPEVWSDGEAIFVRFPLRGGEQLKHPEMDMSKKQILYVLNGLSRG